MSKTAEGLVEWAKQAYEDGWVYWYGTCGYECTTGLLNRKTNQYPDHYTSNRRAAYEKHIAAGKVCGDCIGLFKSYAWDEDGDIDTRESDYGANGHPDKSARQALNACKVKGKIGTIPEIPGLAVWTQTGGHIGLYVGNGEVIELRGYGKNIQWNKLRDRAFTTWGLYPYTTYTTAQEAVAKAAAAVSDDSGSSTLRKGSKGAAVEELQELLLSRGYSLPNYGADGDYGNETVAAVKEFQKDNGLEADGICGPKTWAALKATPVVPAVKYSVAISGVTKTVAEKIIAQYGGKMIEEG